ncbi:hypothetical protein [Pseudomaricurvus sp. HS19]|uniref:hypothetical protein n=1 Tax=Pseudomaricurvus sp. HS19 TaxID=2692626 RepID=UPI001368940A|nr:hypothetical protein [Pseudomaricurvus sp. HS19]MYM62362.1 hypothetical protein [Pseudomaricurvus sp. HS19]
MLNSMIKKYRVPALLLGGLLPAAAGANTESRAAACETTTVVHAYYQISRQRQGETATQSTIEVIRNHHQVAYRNPDLKVTDLWEQTPKQRLHLVRYFDAYERGIEYQPNEIEGSHDWGAKYFLISEQQRQSMGENDSATNCAEAKTLVSRSDDGNLTLRWSSHYQLPESISLETPAETTEWKLLKVEADSAVVESSLQQLGHYQTTDYTDIGDSESDPFLRKMINLGFVEHGHHGVYDADGHDLGGEHNH